MPLKTSLCVGCSAFLATDMDSTWKDTGCTRLFVCVLRVLCRGWMWCSCQLPCCCCSLSMPVGTMGWLLLECSSSSSQQHVGNIWRNLEKATGYRHHKSDSHAMPGSSCSCAPQVLKTKSARLTLRWSRWSTVSNVEASHHLQAMICIL